AHVVENSSSVQVRFPSGQTYDATVVGVDASTDLAVIDVDAPSSAFHPLTLADSSALSVGEEVVAIGSPFGLENTVTSGIVSALDRSMQAPNGYTINGAVQTDAAINHGNSGGPLLGLDRQVDRLAAGRRRQRRARVPRRRSHRAAGRRGRSSRLRRSQRDARGQRGP